MKIKIVVDVPDVDCCDTCDHYVEEWDRETKAGKPMGCGSFRITKDDNKKLPECLGAEVVA